MGQDDWGVEWLNANSQRSYPLADDATATDETGDFTLPSDFLVALYIPVHAGINVEPHKFFIRSIAIFATGYNISVGYDDGTSDPPIVASAVVSRSSLQENNSYVLVGVDDFDDTVGKLAIGRTAGIDLQPAGQYLFDFAGGKLDPDCIRPQIRGVSSISVQNGGDLSARLVGDVELVAGKNFSLTVTEVSGLDTRIRLDAIQGAGLNTDCSCTGDSTNAPPIRRINGIPGTPDGNFTITGDNCIAVTELANGLQFSDTCSAPCCDCVELAAITQDLARFGAGATTLQNFVNRLDVTVTQMSMVVLGSKLNDSGCNTG